MNVNAPEWELAATGGTSCLKIELYLSWCNYQDFKGNVTVGCREPSDALANTIRFQITQDLSQLPPLI